MIAKLNVGFAKIGKKSSAAKNSDLMSLVDSLSFRRSITSDWPKKVVVREFVIGINNKEPFESFQANFWWKFGRDQYDLPTRVVSFNMEIVPCTLFNLTRMVANPDKWVHLSPKKGDKRDIPSKFLLKDSDKGTNFPAKVMFSGCDWVHLIKRDS